MRRQSLGLALAVAALAGLASAGSGAAAAMGDFGRSFPPSPPPQRKKSRDRIRVAPRLKQNPAGTKLRNQAAQGRIGLGQPR